MVQMKRYSKAALYNYSFELHRFHRAISQIHNEDSEDKFPDISSRCQWVLDNPDIVAVMHAISAEMCIRQVMPNIIPYTEANHFNIGSVLSGVKTETLMFTAKGTRQKTQPLRT